MVELLSVLGGLSPLHHFTMPNGLPCASRRSMCVGHETCRTHQGGAESHAGALTALVHRLPAERRGLLGGERGPRVRYLGHKSAVAALIGGGDGARRTGSGRQRLEWPSAWRRRSPTGRSTGGSAPGWG